MDLEHVKQGGFLGVERGEYAVAVLFPCPSSCAAISTPNRMVTALCNCMSCSSIRMHLIGAGDTGVEIFPLQLVVALWAAPRHCVQHKEQSHALQATVPYA